MSPHHPRLQTTATPCMESRRSLVWNPQLVAVWNHAEGVYVTLTPPPKFTYNVPLPPRICINQKNFNIFCNFLSNHLQNRNECGIIIDIKADFVEILVFQVAKSTQKTLFSRKERKPCHSMFRMYWQILLKETPASPSSTRQQPRSSSRSLPYSISTPSTRRQDSLRDS